MASQLNSCWICLWIITLLRSVSADPASTPRYVIHRTEVSFDEAVNTCSTGILTTLATKQEVDNILQLVSRLHSPHEVNFSYWVGLKKPKSKCIVSELPLKGFKWMDGSEEIEIPLWKKEPEQTCTVRCAALKGEFSGSTVTKWGLSSVSCKNPNPFICKLTDRQTARRPEDQKPEPVTLEPTTPELTTPQPKPATPQPKPAAPEPKPAAPQPKPATPEPKPATPEPKPVAPEPKPAAPQPKPATPEPKPATPEPKPATPEPTPATPEPKPATPEPGTEPDAGPELDCIPPVSPSVRSLSLHPDNSKRIQVECWSSVQLELHCSGPPAMWRLQDDSPVNFTAACLLCMDGFEKDASGNCVDIDECSGSGGSGGSGGDGPCRHTCLNTEGSYKCVCSDQDGKHHNEDSEVCKEVLEDAEGGALSGVLIWVIVAVAALIVLVVVVAVAVKCYLMKRSKKRAMKKAEKMAMDSKDGKDSYRTANEKTIT